MKNFKYIAGFLLLAIGIHSCDVNNTLPAIEDEAAAAVALEANGLNLSKYIAVGASFTAGFSDGALFIATQENSFPNILASKFALADGGSFTQPLMSDNVGGFTPNPNNAFEPRLIFNGTGPARLDAAPTTRLTARAEGANFNNFGIPGAKSFHLTFAGYGTLNPYFGRMASSATASVIGDALAQQPTFFTLSEVGGNDVLQYATSGGSGVDQTGNIDPTTYGTNDITDPNVFNVAFTGLVNGLTSTGAKGVVTTVPDVSLLPFFTTVPFNALDPTTNATLKAQVPLLNQVYGALNLVYTALGQTNRVVTFIEDDKNPVVIKDENLTDISAQITGALSNSPQFSLFVQSFGLSEQAVPLVANLFGTFYGQARPATANDLLVLPSSSVIGTVNTANTQFLVGQGFSLQLAGQFSAEGLTLPLADQWVLTPEEQSSIKNAADAYNATIKTTANNNPNLALVDLDALLIEASGILGLSFDDFSLTTDLVTGGLISLDGIHLTSRGYALLANKILAAMDEKFGSNFTEATNGLAKAVNYPTNYSPALR